MTTVYIISLFLLAIGGLLCFRGLKLYKYAQMLLCGAIGGYIGLLLVGAFSRQEFYILALILTAIGAFLGYKYYKYSLYVTISLSAFVVTFSYFWKQAVEVASGSIGQIMTAKEIIVNNFSGEMNLQGLLNSFDVVMGVCNSNWAGVLKAAEKIIKHGLFVSAAVAMVAGILTIWIGDYVIMVVSAALGSMLLVNLVDMFVTISPMMHLLLLVVLGIAGVIVQYMKCKKRRK